MSRRKSKVVWHYTYQHNIKRILESQVLLPPYLIPGYVDAVELAGYTPDRGTKADRKLLLFSENEVWEPASYRGFANFLGVVDVHKLEDYADYGCAVFRIGVETKHLKPYTALCRSVSMPKKMFDGLWKIAVRIGSNPYQWWGTTKPIPMSEWVSVEVFANGVWNDCFADGDAPTDDELNADFDDFAEGPPRSTKTIWTNLMSRRPNEHAYRSMQGTCHPGA